jgi:hypothetical protein
VAVFDKCFFYSTAAFSASAETASPVKVTAFAGDKSQQ